MRRKSILATSAVVLGLGVGPALAAGPLPAEATNEGFAALAGVPAEALSAAEMDTVVGQAGFIQFKSVLESSASKGDSLLLFGVKLIDADSGDVFKVMPALGVHWESTAELEAAIGTPTLEVSQAGLGLVRSMPSVAQSQ